MKNSLYVKFLLGYLVFGLLGLILVGTASSHFLSQTLQEKEAEALYEEATALAEGCSSLYFSSSDPLWLLRSYLDDREAAAGAQIWLVDADGTIFCDENGHYLNRTVPGFDPLDFSSSYRIDNFYGMFDEEQISVCIPINARFAICGYVVMVKPLASLDTLYYNLLDHLYLAGGLVYLASLVLLWIFARTVYSPLRKITEGSRQFAQGNLSYQIEVESNDEIGRLADTMNYMSRKLSDIETYQRKFVSNVSHDFRSPLTSIGGYVEAMLDGVIPPENQEKYLKIIRSETNRLNKLTQDLLTLNSIGEKGSYLNCSVFDINREIKALCETFEGPCLERHLTFDLTFDRSSLNVYADAEKIQRVLYNLLDNALKFSAEGATVWVETYSEHEKAFISVKDEGIGIPKADLSKIWERFYKTDASRGKDKKGTGLGLSIVKEIIQSHQEHIDVISTEGIGTQFIFSLPLAQEQEPEF